jgi:hypothetical protein
MRQLFMPIAVTERHVQTCSQLSTYDLAERLVEVWGELEKDALSEAISLQPDCILGINARIAKAMDAEPGTFNRESDWPQFVEACGSIEDRLTRFKLSTAWLYTNALRVQLRLPALYLSFDRLGPFLESLSGSGPPLYDGQTFYLEDYARPAKDIRGT